MSTYLQILHPEISLDIHHSKPFDLRDWVTLGWSIISFCRHYVLITLDMVLWFYHGAKKEKTLISYLSIFMYVYFTYLYSFIGLVHDFPHGKLRLTLHQSPGPRPEAQWNLWASAGALFSAAAPNKACSCWMQKTSENTPWIPAGISWRINIYIYNPLVIYLSMVLSIGTKVGMIHL